MRFWRWLFGRKARANLGVTREELLLWWLHQNGLLRHLLQTIHSDQFSSASPWQQLLAMLGGLSTTGGQPLVHDKKRDKLLRSKKKVDDAIASAADAEAKAKAEAEAQALLDKAWDELEGEIDQRSQQRERKKLETELQTEQPDEQGHRTSLSNHDFEGEPVTTQLESVYRKASALMELFAFEIDFTRRIEGQTHWSAERIVQTMLRRRPHRLRDAKYARPMDVDVALVVDVSGSCEPQANMFMAIAAGCIGPNVKVYVSFNGVIIPQALRPPTHRPNDYTDATAWVQQAFDEVQASSDFNLEFSEFVSQEQPKTVIILGDHDGIDLYRTAVADPRNRSRKFFWIANVVDSNPPEFIPEGFNAKNYIADVMEPKDFIRAVKKLRAI